MKLTHFDFELPEDRIAKRPVSPRDKARMLYINAETIKDDFVFNLESFLNKNDILIFNNTRVIPARLHGVRVARRGSCSVEITLNKQLNSNKWSAMAKPLRRFKVGDLIKFENMTAIVDKIEDRGFINLKFSLDNNDLYINIKNIGEIPLPPYINRKADHFDRSDYQTIFSQYDGAVAAPTAGLHFTDQIFSKLTKKGIDLAFLTLHVGAGTFLPINVKDIDDHFIYPEWGEISVKTCLQINRAKKRGGRVIAVGTTTLRLLEAAVNCDGVIEPFNGETNIFLKPGHQYQSADILLTNFHLPKSTLFMLVCSFMGINQMRNAYQHAVLNNYRFYSYGDCCLLERSK